MKARWFGALLAGALCLALVFLTLADRRDLPPGRRPASWSSGSATRRRTDALRLSLITSGIALALILVVGTPAAYLLATRSFRGRSLAITAIELPLVLPPAVAGIGLLAAFGPEGLLGGAIEDAGARLVFETAGVVVALTFVASPFYLRQAQAAFEAVDPTWIQASRTLGSGEARTFARVAIPAAMPGLAAGTALAWGRALGEFGATLVFAGSFQGSRRRRRSRSSSSSAATSPRRSRCRRSWSRSRRRCC